MALSDVARTVADAVTIRFFIIMNLFSAACDYILDDTNMTGQCFAAARTFAHAVAYPFVAVAYFVFAICAWTLDLLQYLLVAACALFVALSMYLAFKTLRPILGPILYPIYVYYTERHVKTARHVKPTDTPRVETFPDLPTDIVMTDAPPLPPAKKVSPSIKSTSKAQLETAKPLKRHSEYRPYTVTSTLSQKTLDAIVSARKAALDKKKESEVTVPLLPTAPTQPDSSRADHTKPTSKPEQGRVQFKATRDSEQRPPISASPDSPIPDAAPDQPAQSVESDELKAKVEAMVAAMGSLSILDPDWPACQPARPSALPPASMPSEDTAMPEVPEVLTAAPAAECDTGMQGVEVAEVSSFSAVQEEVMMDDAQPAVAEQSPEVLEQEMEDVVASAPVARNVAPLFAQASLRAPQQAAPALVALPVRPEVQEVEMDDARNDAPLQAQASLQAPQQAPSTPTASPLGTETPAAVAKMPKATPMALFSGNGNGMPDAIEQHGSQAPPQAAKSQAPSPTPSSAPAATPSTISANDLSHVAVFKGNTSANATMFAEEAARETEGTGRVFPKQSYGRAGEEGATNSRKRIALASPSARDSPDPMLPTADFHPLKDAAMTAERATGLIDSWVRSSNTMLSGLLRTLDEKKIDSTLELLLRRIQHIDEYLLAENRCWKVSTVGLPDSWKHEVVSNLKDVERLLELVGNAFGRSMDQCLAPIVEICRFSPGSSMMKIPEKFSRLYELLSPTCEVLHKKIKDLQRNGTTYKPEPYWNMLKRGDHDRPFFDESWQVIFDVHALVSRYPDWWKHMIQNNFGSGSEEVLIAMKDDIRIVDSWLEALVGQHGTKAKAECRWLYDVGMRTRGLYRSLTAEIAKKRSA
ncbi:hypothetical protein CERZMDRAFT_84695 [Cercospora zeae-maydis SCOH1-5]|uniref:Uncharacterized protein n=1 Tax=Cercospora zeae-maydis SCOH1-5 TaxID=717836 RepID=A0A6A6FFR3_9PEZI|nr:hypothetical protein CERZMDRAFT_84695 [Cercospora zeae-maydis SCOH1-5]